MSNPVEEFLKIKEAQDKEAGFWSSLSNAFRGGPKGQLADRMGTEVGKALPAAIASAGIAAIGVGVGKGVGAIRNQFSKQRDYKAMLEANPSLQKRPAKQVQMMFNSVRSMAPSIAADPITAGSFIDNAMELSGNRAAMPTQSAKMLAETQRNLAQSKGRSGAIMDAWTSAQPDRPAPRQPPMLRRTRQREDPLKGRSGFQTVTEFDY